MDELTFKEILAKGHEQRGVEFKVGLPRSDKPFMAQVIRAVLGMANRRDGGLIIIGIDDSSGQPEPTGISNGDIQTWKYDDFADSLAEYADPSVSFELEEFTHESRDFLLIHVQEFEDIPVLCKKDYQTSNRKILRMGACYIRSRRKPETVEVSSQADMRDLLDLAIEKGVRKFVSQARIAGLEFSGSPQKTDKDLFDEQVDNFIGDLS